MLALQLDQGRHFDRLITSFLDTKSPNDVLMSPELRSYWLQESRDRMAQENSDTYYRM